MATEQKKRKRIWWILLLLLLFLGVLLTFFFFQAKEKKDTTAPHLADSLKKSDSLRKADSLKAVKADSLKAAKADSLKAAKADSLKVAKAKRAKAKSDSLREIDSLKQLQYDSIKVFEEKCAKDSIAPWVYPDPSGGVHYQSVRLSFVANEPATIWWKFDGEKSFKKYQNEVITIKTDKKILYKAEDFCGNKLPERSKSYEIKKRIVATPEGMVLITTPTDTFYIDAYEWPNKRGRRPKNNVTFAEAMDSCFLVGKRLCTADEWESACRGPYNWKYPYGSSYERYACVTQERSRQKSGKSGACRGWYPLYDMVGNLAEWTSTRSAKNKKFYIVKGGFWESGSRGSCELSRYSYYPQNHHNTVGFRCCKDYRPTK